MRLDGRVRMVLLGGFALMLLFGSVGAALAWEPVEVPKYVEPLVIPPEMPESPKDPNVVGPRNFDYYEIAVRQFEQYILPTDWSDANDIGPTTVWSYGSVDFPETFNYPAFTIEADVGTPTRVKWINDLVDENGDYLPHLLPVDQTLHWANPPAGVEGRDMEGTSQEPYTGPVPIISHLHGAEVTEDSDGYPEAWYLPAADNIPAGYALGGSLYDSYKQEFEDRWGQPWEPGTAVFQYLNRQRATTLWYHDHSLGMTRLNVYAGPAGFYLLRGGDDDVITTEGGEEAGLPGPAPAIGDEAGTDYFEIPIVVQTRSFNQDGELFYPDNREFFEGLQDGDLDSIPFSPDSEVAPIWNPEFFPEIQVVNGKTWPYLEVEPKQYRFRLLNGSQSRFYIFRMTTEDVPASYVTIEDLPGSDLDFYQIGADGGFLADVVEQEDLLMGPAERADVIVDFSELPVGTEVTMLNLAGDEPFGGGQPVVDFPAADPQTTGQIMKFVVVEGQGADPSTPVEELVLPDINGLGEADEVRHLSLNEEESAEVFVEVDEEGAYVLDESGQVVPSTKEEGAPFGPTEALLGTFEPATGTAVELSWDDPMTELPLQGAVETWMLHNFTADAHPIHLHLVQFQVMERRIESVDSPHYNPADGMDIGDVVPAVDTEDGWKDTVIAYPGEVTELKTRFDLGGLFVWHCHILEHEDNEMMRPYFVQRTRVTYFDDVAPDHEFAAAIEALSLASVVDGYENGEFGLSDPVLRAQIAKMTAIAYDLHDEAIDNMNDPTFGDVMYEGEVYPFDYIEEAAEAGLVLGYVNGNFAPYDQLTRIQLVRILVRAAGDRLDTPPAGYQLPFTDVAAMDRDVLSIAHYNELLDGTSATTFDPYGTATRGHVAKILYNSLTK